MRSGGDEIVHRETRIFTGDQAFANEDAVGFVRGGAGAGGLLAGGRAGAGAGARDDELAVARPRGDERIEREIKTLSVGMRLACALIKSERGGASVLGTTAMLHAINARAVQPASRVQAAAAGRQVEPRACRLLLRLVVR